MSTFWIRRTGRRRIRPVLAFVAFVASGLLSPIQSQATGDLDAPVLEDLTVGADPVVAGDSVTVSWRLSDVSGVAFTTVFIRNPSGRSLSGCGGGAAVLVEGSATNGLYEQSCVIPASAPAGTYTVLVSANDPNGNDFEDSTRTFEVKLQDDGRPRLTAITIAPLPAMPGEPVTVTWTLSHPSSVFMSSLAIRRPESPSLPGCGMAILSLNVSPTSQTFQTTCDLPELAPGGNYQVRLFGHSGGGSSLQNVLGAIFLLDGGSGDTSKPQLFSIDVVPEVPLPGTTMNLKWTITDSSDIIQNGVQIKRGPGGINYLQWCEEPIFGGRSGDQVTYEMSCAVPATAPRGPYAIDIQFQDAVGNFLHANSVATFEVDTATGDEVGPSLEDVSFINGIVSPGDTVSLTVNLSDESAIEYASVDVKASEWELLGDCSSFESPQEYPTQLTLTLTCEVPENTLGGTYAVEVHASDTLGNETSNLLATSLIVLTSDVAILSGRVVTRAGDPVSGATVSLQRGGTTMRTRTDSSGTYKVASPKSDGYSLKVALDGARTAASFFPPDSHFAVNRFVLLSDLTQELIVPTPRKVIITVRDSSNNIAPNIQVEQAYTDGSLPEGHELIPGRATTSFAGGDFGYRTTGGASVTKTDTTGRVEVWVLQDHLAAVRLTRTLTGGSTATTVDILDEALLEETEVDALLVDIATWTGIMRTADGEPVSGAEVSFGKEMTFYSTRTNDQGEFELGAPIDSGYTLSVSGSQVRTASIRIPSFNFSTENVSFTANRTQDFTLPPIHKIDLTVLDSAAMPAANARVSRSWIDYDTTQIPAGYELFPGMPISGTSSSFGYGLVNGRLQTVTNVEGKLSVWSFPSTIDLVSVRYPSTGASVYYPVKTNILVISDTAFELRLPDTVELSGVLRAADGEPVINAYVSLDIYSSSITSTTNLEGEFAVRVPVGNTYSLRVGTDAARTTSMKLPSNVLYINGLVLDEDRNVSLTLPQTVKINVTVKDREGNLVPGAEVVRDPMFFPLQTLPSGYTILPGYSTDTYTSFGFGYALDGEEPQRTTDTNGVVSVWTFPGTVDRLRATIDDAAMEYVYGYQINATSDSAITIPQSHHSLLGGGDGIPGVLLSSPAGTTIERFERVPIDPQQLPAGVTPATESLSFQISGVTPGATVTVRVLVMADEPANGLFKISGGSIIDITNRVTFDGWEISYQVTDGGVGDEDGVANGIIVDPVLPTYGEVPPQPGRPTFDFSNYEPRLLPDTL